MSDIKIKPSFRSNRKIYKLIYRYISTSVLTISSMSERSLGVSFCCAPWPELACSHQWFHGWLQLFLDYSCVVFGAKGKTRLTRLWICELSWKARGLVLMEGKWTHTSRAHTLSTLAETHVSRHHHQYEPGALRTESYSWTKKKKSNEENIFNAEFKADALFCFNATSWSECWMHSLKGYRTWMGLDKTLFNSESLSVTRNQISGGKKQKTKTIFVWIKTDDPVRLAAFHCAFMSPL